MDPDNFDSYRSRYADTLHSVWWPGWCGLCHQWPAKSGSVRSLGGGVVMMGGGANFDIVFSDGSVARFT